MVAKLADAFRFLTAGSDDHAPELLEHNASKSNFAPSHLGARYSLEVDSPTAAYSAAGFTPVTMTSGERWCVRIPTKPALWRYTVNSEAFENLGM